MGKFILPPLKFVLIVILSAVVFLLFSLIYQWGAWVSLADGMKNSLLLFIPSTAFGVIIPSITSGLLFTFFSYRDTKIHPSAAVLITAAAFIIIFFGFRFTSTMADNPEAVSFQPFNERKLHSTEGAIIYTDEIEESGRIKGIIIRSTGSELPGFKYYESGKLIKGEHPELSISEGRRVDIMPRNPVFHETLLPGKMLGRFLSDIDFLNTTFKQAAASGQIQFILLSAAMMAFLMSCLLFQGATVWPLFDFILIISFHRLVFYVFALFSKESDFVTETLFGGRPVDLPLISIAASAALIFLLGILIRLTGRRSKA